MDTLVKYNFSSKEEISSRNSVPILAWDFHYESVNELKAVNEDLKKLDEFSSKFRWNTEKFNIKQRISQEVVIITDVEQTIVFASNGILNMTGYSKEEVVGQKPKMFQGSSTSPTVRKEIRKAIELSVPFDKTVINHKKNGSTYKCKINCFPIFNVKGQLSHYIAFERAA
nr:PAS domain-containing protein [uncultured Flavobacterium sp.]